MEQIITAGLKEMALPYPPEAPAKLAEYGRLLLEKNQVMNLTAIRDPEGVARLHMLDSAALLRCGDFANKTLIDVGTGAGFPGLALKLLVPSLQVTLLDSLNKRLDWLGEVSAALNLEQVRTIHARAEEQALVPGDRDSFDFAAARAVAELRILCELCLPFVKPGGYFLAMKGPDSEEELDKAASALKRLGGEIRQIVDYSIPGTEVKHRIICVQKMTPTPKGLPRRWARIQKEAL